MFQHFTYIFQEKYFSITNLNIRCSKNYYSYINTSRCSVLKKKTQYSIDLFIGNSRMRVIESFLRISAEYKWNFSTKLFLAVGLIYHSFESPLTGRCAGMQIITRRSPELRHRHISLSPVYTNFSPGETRG